MYAQIFIFKSQLRGRRKAESLRSLGQDGLNSSVGSEYLTERRRLSSIPSGSTPIVLKRGPPPFSLPYRPTLIILYCMSTRTILFDRDQEIKVGSVPRYSSRLWTSLEADLRYQAGQDGLL